MALVNTRLDSIVSSLKGMVSQLGGTWSGVPSWV
jgi:hypothetical protein